MPVPKTQSTRLFRLKAGTHHVGSGRDARVYKANKPGQNIVESDEDLAALDPGRWEAYSGPAPAVMGVPAGPEINLGTAGHAPPPGPPSETVRGIATMRAPATPGEARARAEELRRLAETLERQAEQGESGGGGGGDATPLFETDPSQPQADPSTIVTSGRTVPQTDAERTAGAGIGAQESDGLDDMKVSDLRALAEGEEIELPNRATKEEIITAIRKSRGGA